MKGELFLRKIKHKIVGEKHLENSKNFQKQHNVLFLTFFCRDPIFFGWDASKIFLINIKKKCTFFSKIGKKKPWNRVSTWHVNFSGKKLGTFERIKKNITTQWAIYSSSNLSEHGLLFFQNWYVKFPSLLQSAPAPITIAL